MSNEDKDFTMNDMALRNLKRRGKEYTRREKGGFGVRVHPSGTKTLFYMYRVAGQRRFLNLGEYYEPKSKGEPKGKRVTLADAREAYEIERKKVDLLHSGHQGGIDPVAVKKVARQHHDDQNKAFTVADLIKEYISKHAEPSKRSWREDERILKKDALAVWGKRKAADIKKRDVVLLLESIIDRGSPGSANNNFKIIRKMFRFAVQRDILPHSPCDGVVMPAPLNRGDRVLSETETKALWSNLDTCNASDDIKRAIRLILATGQRPGEVIGMHSEEIDGRWWTIPAERSKNKKAHRVYLTDTALELIGDTNGRGFIFPCTNTKKTQPMGRLSISQVVWRNLSAPVLVNGKQAFDKEGNPITENKLGVADFTPHDLRRTAATFMSQLGMMDEVIDAVLNHTKQGIIRTYNLNRYDKEKQMALESWDRKLNSIITGEASGKVVSIRKGKKKAA